MATVLTPRDYKSDVHINWCPGCGDFGIVNAIQMALAELKLPPHRVAVFSGIGCSGKTPHYIHAYGYHTLHGRVLPVATGAKLSNKDLTVLAVGGDGDGYGIGSGYFVNSGRRNVDITYIVFNNSVYGLTKGQGSPTLKKGLRTKSMPEAAIQDGINPLALAVSSGYTFVARGFALDPRGLAGLIAAGVRHRGSSFIDVLQTCPTYNDLYTAEWYNHTQAGGPRLYRLAETGYDGKVKDPADADEVVAKKVQAIAKSYEWGEKIPVGVYYEVDLPTYEDALADRNPRYGQEALVDTDFADRDVDPLLDALR